MRERESVYAHTHALNIKQIEKWSISSLSFMRTFHSFSFTVFLYHYPIDFWFILAPFWFNSLTKAMHDTFASRISGMILTLTQIFSIVNLCVNGLFPKCTLLPITYYQILYRSWWHHALLSSWYLALSLAILHSKPNLSKLANLLILPYLSLWFKKK